MTSPCASVIIRCYNEADHIGKLLHGVFEQTLGDFEVILVDSGSNDGTLEVARQYPIDDVVYIDPSEFSFGRALNFGIERAHGEFCVFASAHVYPKRNDWLERLLEKFQDDNVALVYGKQRGNEVTKFSEKQIFKQWFPEHDIDHQDSPFCNNANCAIRRKLWEEHPYDEELTGLEDLDWTKRIQRAGYEISYASEAEIIHVHNETARGMFNRYRREGFAHKQIMEEQTFSFLDFLKAFVSNSVSDYAAAIRQRKFGSTLIEIPYFRFLQFSGTYRGFNQTPSMNEQLKQRFYYPNKEGYPTRRGGDDANEDRTIQDAVKERNGEEIDYSNVGISGEVALE